MANSPALPDSEYPRFNIITKALDTSSDAQGRKRFSAIASSSIVDRAGDEITVSALQKMAEKFRAGMTIFVDHNKSAYNAFGTTDTADVRSGGQTEDGAQIWDLHIAGIVNEPSPRAMELYNSIDGGYVKLGTSIGAFVLGKPKKKDGGGLVIDDLDPFEASIVGVPMNQRSWAYKAAKAIKSFYGEPDEEPEVTQTAHNGFVVTTVNTGYPVNDNSTITIDVQKGIVVGEDGPETVVLGELVKNDASGCTCSHDGSDCGADCDCAAHKSIEETQEVSDTKEATADAPETSPEVTPETVSADGQETDAVTPETASGSMDRAFDPDDVVGLVGHVQKLAALLNEREETIVALTTEKAELTAKNVQLAEENEDAKATIERMLRMPLQRKAVSEVTSLSKRLPDFLDPRITDFLNQVSGERA